MNDANRSSADPRIGAIAWAPTGDARIIQGNSVPRPRRLISPSLNAEKDNDIQPTDTAWARLRSAGVRLADKVISHHRSDDQAMAVSRFDTETVTITIG